MLHESVSRLQQLFFDRSFLIGATVLLLRVHATFQRAVTHVISTPDFLLSDLSNLCCTDFCDRVVFFISYALLVFIRV